MIDTTREVFQINKNKLQTRQIIKNKVSFV
jgi:hypothetical protein